MNELAPIDTSPGTEMIEFTAEIVAAYVSKNPVGASELPKLIAEVHGSLARLNSVEVTEPVAELKPAVPVRKSITPDYLVCLDDGLKFKSLKRHLSALGMTPEQYREKWNLPADYPMVAPNYSATRSKLALSNGLGRRPVEPESEVVEAAQAEVTFVAPVKPKSRRRAKEAAVE